MTAYYNENAPYVAQWLRNLIAAGHIAAGDVDERSIVDVRADDLRGYTQCHFFAGIGGWSYALRLAGWPDDRPVWTGSCPCQPFSRAAVHGKRGFDDARHLWPEWRRLVEERHPAIILGEQSADAAAWLRLVRGDLVEMGYAVGCAPIEAASVGADHLRDRFWFVAHADFDREYVLAVDAEMAGTPLFAADPNSARLPRRSEAGTHSQDARDEQARNRSIDDAARALRRHRAHRPVLGAGFHGLPGRVAAVHAAGNAIVPQAGAAFISAVMECIP